MVFSNGMLLGRGAGGGGALNVEDVFDIQIDSAANLDALSTDDWDLLVGKSRVNATDWSWRDSERGLGNTLASNGATQQTAFSNYATKLGSGNAVLTRFKKAPGFLDIVDHSTPANSSVPHGLNAEVGMIIFKKYDSYGWGWPVYHRALGAGKIVDISSGAKSYTGTGYFNNTAPTSTDFTVGTSPSFHSGVAYLFAHDPSPEGIIQCGSYTGLSFPFSPTITTGWQAQYIMIKRIDAPGDWVIIDTTRGIFSALYPNTLGAELTSNAYQIIFNPTTTHIQGNDPSINADGGEYIYMAIRAPGT